MVFHLQHGYSWFFYNEYVARCNGNVKIQSYGEIVLTDIFSHKEEFTKGQIAHFVWKRCNWTLCKPKLIDDESMWNITYLFSHIFVLNYLGSFTHFQYRVTFDSLYVNSG